MLTVLQASAILTLWRSGQWDTFDIASVLQLTEGDAIFVIDLLREHDEARSGVVLPFKQSPRKPRPNA